MVTYSEMDTGVFISPKTAGMGMAGASLTDTPEAIFLNPALIATVKKPSVYLASYKILEDVTNINSAFCLPFGGWGVSFGYRGKQIPGISMIEAGSLLYGAPNPSAVEDAAYQQSFTSFGLGFTLFSGQGFVRNLSAGLAYKSFYADTIGGGSIDEAGGFGNDLDLGLYSDVNDYWSVGLNVRNALVYRSGSSGGAFFWRTGTRESFPSIYTLSNKFTHNNGGFIVLFDANFYEAEYLPTLLNAGFQISLSEYLKLRSGIHQDAVLTGSGRKVYNSLTAGFSVTPFKDFNFDYAYFPSDSFAMDAVHYAGFSLDSFELFFPPAGVNKQGSVQYEFTLLDPKDYAVIEKNTFELSCRVRGVTTININETVFPVSSNNFQRNFDLEEGVNLFEISCLDRNVKRKVLKVKDYPSLVEAKQDKDVRKVIYTKNFNSAKFPGGGYVTLQEAADHIAASLKLRVPQEFNGVFTNLDILYLNGFFGSTEKSTGTSIQAKELVTKGEFAVLLARVEGYDYVFQGIEKSDQEAKAVEILSQSTYYSKAEFIPFNEKLTRRELITLLGKSGAVNTAMKELYDDFPMAWIDCNPQTAAAGNKGNIVLFNAEKFIAVEQITNGKSVRSNIQKQGIALIPFEYNLSAAEETFITFNITDKYGNVQVYSFAFGKAQVQSAAVSNVSLLVKTDPKEIFPGIKAAVELGIPDGEQYDSIMFSSEIMETPAAMENKGSGIWSGVLDVDNDIQPGKYNFKFILRKNGAEQIKNYPVRVSGVSKVVSSSDVARSSVKIMTKIAVPVVKYGDELLCYVGVVSSEEIALVKLAFSDGEEKEAVRVNSMLWKVQKKIDERSLPGKAYFKVYVRTKTGYMAQQKGNYRIENAAPKTVVKSQPAGKVYYPAHVTIIPSAPSAGEKIKIKAFIKDPKIVKVTCDPGNGKISLQKSSEGYWYGYYAIPISKKGKNLILKVYVKDRNGAFSATERVIKVK